MHSLGKKAKRFSLLFLEEGEIYHKDCMGSRYHFEMFPERRQEKGRIHVCSRSLIFEPTDHETPIVKYSFRDMENSPQEVIVYRNPYGNESQTRLRCSLIKIIILPNASSPASYITHKLDTAHMVEFDFDYESVSSLTQSIAELYGMNSSHNAGFDQDSEGSAFTHNRERHKIKFDMTRIESIIEKPIIQNPILVKRITPFMILTGILYITDMRIYFQPLYTFSSKRVKSVRISQVQMLYKRRYKLRNLAFELYTESDKNIFLAFDNEDERDQIFSLLMQVVEASCETEASVENMTVKWQLGKISNYDYLMYLNAAAYRTFSDFTQYPVFPWVLSNYDDSEIDLNDPANYRDLSKPMGAMEPRRFDAFYKRYLDMPEPKFLYGTHYSAPGYVIGHLFRKFPLYMLRLHGGRFDSPDRLFDSIMNEWNSVNNNPADVKELIPEFYSNDPSFLVNAMQLDLGIKQNGTKVGDVKLPAWARDASQFLSVMRQALESKYVSENLHNWIDLIFGYKQKGEHAAQANNLFHPVSYEGYLDTISVTDTIQRAALEIQINEFGQTPKQLFKIPHPPRYPVQEENKESTEETAVKQMWSIESVANRVEPHKINEITLHKKRVSSIHKIGEKAVSTGHDGCVKLVNLDNIQKRSFTVCELPISCSALYDIKTIIAGSYDQKLYLYSLANGRTIETIHAHDDAISCCEYMDNLTLIASGSWDNSVKIWDLRANKIKPVSMFEDHEEQITCMTSCDSYNLITGDKDGRVIIRDMRETHSILSEFQTDAYLSGIANSQHSDSLVAVLPDRVSVYERNGNEVCNLPVTNTSTIATDGLFVMTGKEDSMMEMWEMMKGDLIFRLNGVTRVSALYASPMGDEFLAGNIGGTLYHIR